MASGNLTQSIDLTDSAHARIEHVMGSNKELGSKFRVYVTGGGCSGFQYGFKFDSEVAFDDDVIEFDNFSVLLDSMSYPYLFGSTLDFVDWFLVLDTILLFGFLPNNSKNSSLLIVSFSIVMKNSAKR